MIKMIIFSMIAFTLFATACSNKNSAGNTTADNKQSATDTINTMPLATAGKTILFFGNSLTAGYGVDPEQAFPALIQQKIDLLQLPYKVINGGVSGETSADGNQRVDFVLKQQPIDMFVLELGANDAFKGMALAETRKNLQLIIDKVKAKYPAAKLVMAGMQIPPDIRPSYAADFKNIYPDLARKNNMTLIPFLLQGVGGEARLNQQDGLHPTAAGYEVVADNVWLVLKGLL